MSSIMNSGIYTKALEIAEQAIVLAGISSNEVQHAIDTKRKAIRGCASELDVVSAAFPVFMMTSKSGTPANMYYALMAVYLACTESPVSVMSYVRGYAANVR